MSVISIGGGPRPQLRMVQVSDISAPGIPIITYEIRDGREIVAELKSLENATALLKILQEGE